MKIFIFTLLSIVYLAVAQNSCPPTRCEPLGPVIRFPFRLKDQPGHCGYPGFELSCSKNGRTELNLQFPLTASTKNVTLPLQMTVIVWQIDYEAQKILAGNARAHSCLPAKLPTLSSSASLFEVEALGYGDGYTLFNCSNTRDYETIGCLSSRNYQVILFVSIYGITSLLPYSSCFKMYNISYVPDGALTGRDDEYGTRFYLNWSRPFCGNCEAEGKYCRLRNGGNADETECFNHQPPQHGASRKHKAIIAGMIILVVLIMIASFFILREIKRKKDDEKRIEKVLRNHKDMRPRRYSYTDIKRSTNNFKEKLGQGSYRALHKGMLADGTHVAVKMLNESEQNAEDFIRGVERIGKMQNMNLLQLIGYCVDGRKRALVYEFLQRGSLASFISSEDQRHNLGWERLRQIAVGIAKGVDYVHQECATKILKIDINPQTILLDHSFSPKILVSTTCSVQGAEEYIAPELFSSSFDIISQKADVYSFGMLCLDIVRRRRNFHVGERESCVVHFPEWFYSQLKNGEERAIQIEEGEDEEDMVKKLTIVGLWCIQWFPSDRPSMKAVIQMLEGDNIPSLPPNPFTSSDLKMQN